MTLNQANTYTGVTTITNGTINASALAITTGASSLGNTTSNVILGDSVNKGTLNYTGNSAVEAHSFTVNAGGAKSTRKRLGRR